MLLVISAVSVSMLYNAHRMGLEQFGSEVSADFSVLEMKRQTPLRQRSTVTTAIPATECSPGRRSPD
mgnify:FL=1